MKISTKLGILFGGMLLLIAGMAVIFLSEMSQLTDRYDALLAGEVHRADQARVMQLSFKKQVQEWKDILLRGHRPEDLTKYTQHFREAEAKVRDETLALSRQVRAPAAARLLGEFMARHDLLGKKYQEAYDTYVSSGFDFKAADRIVRGMDRQPTNLFDELVARLVANVQRSATAQQAIAAHKQLIALAITGACLLLLTAGSLIVVLNVSSRLACLKQISDRLAQGEIAGLAIDIDGSDEVGEFGRSLKGVRAAIEDLATSRTGGPVGRA